jgi:hypothetical protein
MNLAQFINRLLNRKPKFGYVSDADKFLQNFDQQHPQKSKSQQKEIEKYRRIFNLRDNSKQ